MANTVGRPKELTAELIEQAKNYIALFNEANKENIGKKIPNIASLALWMGVARSTIYLWKDENKEFSDIYSVIMALQEEMLLENSLHNVYNSTISKLMLTKHGYSDKQEIESKNETNITGKIDLSPEAAQDILKAAAFATESITNGGVESNVQE